MNWGDGSRARASAALSSRNFSLAHVYAAAGTYTVTVTIADDDAAPASTHTVTVTAAGAGARAGDCRWSISWSPAARFPASVGDVLKAELIGGAGADRSRARTRRPRLLLKAVVAEIDLLVRLRVVTAADVAPLRALLVSALG